MIFEDRFGLFNVKPVGLDGEPTGNDGFIVTSYALKVGVPVRIRLAKDVFHLLRKVDGLPVERLPGKETPYLSRDVILGMVYLGLINLEDLKRWGWKFSPFEIPKFHLVKFICQSILCLYEDRNFFWKKEFSQIYRIAFSVPLQDRAFIYRCHDERAPFLYRVIEWVDRRKTPGNSSSKLIAWLKNGGAPPIQTLADYFGADHPITLKARERSES